jgi:hypothetical protein
MSNANATTTTPNPVKVNNGTAPAEGRLCIPYQIDFTAAQSAVIDLTNIQQMQQRISFVQTVFVDNSLNAQPVTLTMANTNQKLTVPANSCAYLPMALSLQNVITVQTTGGIVLQLQLFNFGIAPFVWSALNPVAGGTGGTIPVSDAVLESTVLNGVMSTKVTGNISTTGASGTITAGGTAQALLAANASRQYLRFQNTSSATLWLNDNGGTAGVNVGDSIEIAPGQMYETFPGFVSSKAISVFGATTGQQFACQWA